MATAAADNHFCTAKSGLKTAHEAKLALMKTIGMYPPSQAVQQRFVDVRR